MISLSLVSVIMIGALFMMARHNQKTGWRRERHNLAAEIQESMDQLMNTKTRVSAPAALPPAGLFTPEAALSFSLQLAKLHSTLVMQPSVSPAAVAGAREALTAKV